MQNYELLRQYGAYPKGSVVPEWVVERAGPVAEQVARGIVSPTDKAVNVELRLPEPKTAADPAPDLVDELNRLRLENHRLATDNKTLVAQADSLRSQVAARDKALGQMTADLEHLREACESHQARIAALEADLEQATAPVEA